jgi:UPF0042 nucleotide-binding protein
MRIIVITGLSGSGKSTAIHAFEDRGEFCVDNLPVALIPGLVETVSRDTDDIHDIVLGIDSREGEFLEDFEQVSDNLKQLGHHIEVIYLEAGEESLIRRFSETRRRHPLGGVDIQASLTSERTMLAPLRQAAQHIIDTSTMSVHDLKREIQHRFVTIEDTRSLSLTLLSFGYKYGLPLESDLVIDVRFLPNPHFVPELRPRTGADNAVYEYVMNKEPSQKLLEKLKDLLAFMIPLFDKEGKTYVTVAIGCTGGKHRSVSMVRALHEFISTTMPDYSVAMRHRDIFKD